MPMDIPPWDQVNKVTTHCLVGTVNQELREYKKKRQKELTIFPNNVEPQRQVILLIAVSLTLGWPSKDILPVTN